MAAIIFIFVREEHFFTFSYHDRNQRNLEQTAEQLTIAEEEVPIWNTRVKARYDKEVRLLAKKK